MVWLDEWFGPPKDRPHLEGNIAWMNLPISWLKSCNCNASKCSILLVPLQWLGIQFNSVTLFMSAHRTASNAPNGSATEVGIFIHDGTLPLRYWMLRDFAPTYIMKVWNHGWTRVLLEIVLYFTLIENEQHLTQYYRNSQTWGCWRENQVTHYTHPTLCYLDIVRQLTLKYRSY